MGRERNLLGLGVMVRGMSSLLLTISLFVLTFTLVSSWDMNCPCARTEQCARVKAEFNKGPEVYVFSKGTTNVHLWTWRTINTLVVPPDFDKANHLQADTMCFTHGQRKKFGVTVEFNVTGENPGKINMSHSDVEAWSVDAYLKQTAWNADVVTVNLLPYFRNDQASNKTDHHILSGILYSLRKEMKNVEILCIVPWKPPCSKEEGACYFAKYAREGCDYYLLNPDSFLDTDNTKCYAQANIPLTKLLYGISEYNAHFVPSNRIVIGVTWHGYDYTCKTLEHNVCGLQDPPTEEKTTKEDHKCHFNERKRISYGDIVRDHSEDYLSHELNEMYDAPFFNYKVGSENHQVWFEDHTTLKAKYRLAHELGLRGIAILYGDDLSPTEDSNVLANEGLMWSWLSHEMMLKETSKPKEHKDLHWADTVAGVAVGCFLLGALLGVIFSCISMQKRVKKPRAPFRNDMDPLGTDYTDDPDL